MFPQFCICINKLDLAQKFWSFFLRKMCISCARKIKLETHISIFTDRSEISTVGHFNNRFRNAPLRLFISHYSSVTRSLYAYMNQKHKLTIRLYSADNFKGVNASYNVCQLWARYIIWRKFTAQPLFNIYPYFHYLTISVKKGFSNATTAETTAPLLLYKARYTTKSLINVSAIL